ncbi:MAG: YdcF family protein [Acidobacteriia bacterium]|nr:YdcF family protein [Terriglobia bacterium]
MTRLPLRHGFLLAVGMLVAGAALAERALYLRVRAQAERDEARAAQAIVVFGAAEYNGSPSPVFQARLDHAFDLEERGLAPLLITTGGSGGDPKFTEGGVGRDYLIQRGVAATKIVAETASHTTYENVQAATRLMRERRASSCIAVSDGFHLYRIKLMFASQGITVYTSPAPASPIESDPIQRPLHSLREALICGLWHLGIR